ncbi:toxin Doc [bacterium BMS3Bbin04]|nr:toxin Doc [bacterium BMS3Bbin04]
MPVFLDFDEVLVIHQWQIEKYGGSHGIRDQGLLESALAMPESGFGEEYFHKDVFEMAAAYMFHLIQNHPFHDGNKRIGLAAAYVFMVKNGFQLNAEKQELEDFTLAVANNQTTKEEITMFLRTNTQPL